jgi:hypothetical protein
VDLLDAEKAIDVLTLSENDRRCIMRGFPKSQITFMLYGFIFWLPVGLAIYISILLFSNAEKIGRVILAVAVPDRHLYTGIGLIMCLLIVYVSGLALKLTRVGKALSRIPFIGLFFGQGEVMTIGRLSHMQPCGFCIRQLPFPMDGYSQRKRSN